MAIVFQTLVVIVAYYWFRFFALPTSDCHPADEASAAAICASAQRWHIIDLIAGGLFVFTSLAAWLGAWRRQQRWAKVCDWILIGVLSWIMIEGLIITLDPFWFVFLIPIAILFYTVRVVDASGQQSRNPQGTTDLHLGS
ncbi:MAG: hypothetical protein HYZ09_02025 [Candidatus Kerfeldbacteria bacterium]|nr:hypothetical protein [Candidatus Kerfeldbacteria bacterium]